MRRAVFALLGTTIGTSLLIGAKLGQPAQGEAQLTVDTAGAAGADSPSGSPTGDGSAAPAGTPTAKASPTRAGGKTATPAGPKPAGLRNGTYTGAPVTHEYGTIRVTITVAGGVVTKASASYPTDDPTTRAVNEGAVPTLNSRAVAAKTTSTISTVGGATLTSGAYKSSLQSALDKAKA
ncbi:hypothetical protein [Plantactinospora sp. KBS50]|uniref:FMN-binding protein n=1 Tax=Plantactinospora sp. KBS50 TaxID=2024580 RepID=UPI000BAB0555|nr:hypothetical protein [Plantactinospora sp. KBS50]ASW53899.1 hypothetical protein CIK06_06455 [Plantactinospora sp. KBS50]